MLRFYKTIEFRYFYQKLHRTRVVCYFLLDVILLEWLPSRSKSDSEYIVPNFCAYDLPLRDFRENLYRRHISALDVVYTSRDVFIIVNFAIG